MEKENQYRRNHSLPSTKIHKVVKFHTQNFRYWVTKMIDKTCSRGQQQWGNYELFRKLFSHAVLWKLWEKYSMAQILNDLKNAPTCWGSRRQHVPTEERSVPVNISYRYFSSRTLIWPRSQQTIYLNACILQQIKSHQHKRTSMYKTFINSHISQKVY